MSRLRIVPAGGSFVAALVLGLFLSPIDVLAQVLGPSLIASLTRTTGLSQDELTAKLGEILPLAVDKLTPDGKVPESGILAQAIGMLSRKRS
jgi:uncharacterized protein YidB (DUF937 family)